MIPILYSSITEGTVPSHYGVGALIDCISCQVTEERNGSYELTLTYSVNGKYASEIQPNRFIKAKPNFTDDPQIFRIYKVGKTINGQFTVFAQHISYDLSGKIITGGTAGSCTAACSLLQAKAGNFTINTDKSVSATFTITEPSSVRSWFGGKEGSLLDVYGTGEWKYDNYTASLKLNRGSNRGVQIRYGKNLTDLSQELDMSNLVTGIYPYYIDPDGNLTVGSKVSTGLSLDVTRDITIDFSQDVNPDSATPISTQLSNLATNYINNNVLTTITNSITLNFIQLTDLKDRVDLCDTVAIYFEALGISATAKCITTVWDVLEDRYISTTFGSPRTNITDTIVGVQKEVNRTPSRSFMAEAIARATDLITGNLGGYVVMHDSNGDGEPDEILIMNTADISTATKVWRWNKNGLGYSSTGYAGTYGLAMTADGEIVANFITTGTLNADLIKAGTIEDAAHNSQIDMSNGVAKLKNLYARDMLRVIRNIGGSDVVLATLEAGVNGGLIALGDTSANQLVTLQVTNNAGALVLGDSGGINFATIRNDADGPAFILKNPSNKVIFELFAETNGGSHININNESGVAMIYGGRETNGGGLRIGNHSGTQVAFMATGSAGDGTINVNDSTGSWTINLAGQSGIITCVSVQQTSSKKVKKNIKPIEDSSKILELEAVTFDYKNEAQGKDKRGFIAEDVAEVLPNLVTPETDEAPATLDYIQMIPYLQDIIKKQEARIKALEDKINGAN